MTGIRLPFGAFRRFNICWALWEPRPSHQLSASWSRCIFSSPRCCPPKVTCCTVRFSSALPAHAGGLLRQHLQETAICLSRLKSNKASKRSSRETLQDEDEEDVEEDSSDIEDETEEASSVPKDYKDLSKAVQSFRYDVIMKAGLDISRHKVEEAFYGNLLRLNGEKLWKKSRTVKVGDTLDLIVGQDKETEVATVMRVLLKKALEEKTQTDKYKVMLRRWKNLKVPLLEVSK
nr:mitochondrial transcription rescue factor 1 isoform X2 [Geotrypetes seraphini]